MGPLKVDLLALYSLTTACHKFMFNETQAECESEAALYNV